VRYDLAHLDVLEGDSVREHRPDPFAHSVGGFLGLEHDHRVARAVLICPVPGYKSWGL
jgi:hypothetical protein